MRKRKHKQYELLLGRFQCIPPHLGHISLVKTLLAEGKNVCIGLRESDGTAKNPYTFSQRYFEFFKIFQKEIITGQVVIMKFPDITNIVYGRTPGWGIREIKLDDKIEKISATEIRKKGKNESKKN